MQRNTIFILMALCVCGPATLAQTPAASPVQADYDQPPETSQVRIVRLSAVSGPVRIDRNAGVGYEVAFNNLPIIQGAKLKTENATAEVEFEDNSTLRLTPNTEVEFSTLNRSIDGATASSIQLVRGLVYVSLAKTKGNLFAVTTPRGKFLFEPSSHARASADDAGTHLAVIHGKVQFASGATQLLVGKRHSLVVLADASQPVLEAGYSESAFDEWDQQQAEFYSNNRGHNALLGGTPYGVADLNYYGGFSNIAGCGRVWRPYFIDAAWDPYSSGVWAWYPGSGYTWVSIYPWGWAPFHYGSWLQCSNGSWGWQAGHTWSGLRNTNHWRDPSGPRPPRDPNAPPRRVHAPVRPPSPPTTHPGYIPVNLKQLPVSRLNPDTSTFDIHLNSAGLGVPRDAFRHLPKSSAEAVTNGTLHVPVESFAPPSRSGQLPQSASAGQQTSERNSLANQQRREANSSVPQRSWQPADSNRQTSRGSENAGGSRGSEAGSGNRNGSSSYTPSPSSGGGHSSYSAPPPPPPPPPAPAPSAPAAAPTPRASR